MRVAFVLLVLGCEPVLLAQIHLPGTKRPAQQQQDSSSTKRTVNTTGVVNNTDDNALTILASDSRFLTFKIVPSTKFNDGLALSNIKPGEHVKIVATQDDESFLTATVVSIDDSVPPEDRTKPSLTAADKTVSKPAPKDPEDEGPPHLKYGKPEQTASKHQVQYDDKPYVPPMLANAGAGGDSDSILNNGDRPAATRPRESDPKKELIERARDEVMSFTSTLPNYVCQQFTTRYIRGPGSNGWQAQDIVSANVVYAEGKEDYRNIQINGKSIGAKKMEDMQGSWSTGEFATTLRSLFDPRRFTNFKFVKQSTIFGANAYVYDYSVLRENSDWKIQLGSQSIVPAYSGRVWIDSKSARTLRIETQADRIPEEFPLDTVEASHDYGWVRLSSAAEEFLLPTHSENLSCERGTSLCSRNTIEFRNYHKYSGEAVITFDK